MSPEILSKLHHSAVILAVHFRISISVAEKAARRCWREEPALHDWLLHPNDGEYVDDNYKIFERDYLPRGKEKI